MATEPPLRWRITPTMRRDKIVEAVLKAPPGKIVEIRNERRSDAQNRLMWPLLTDISNQVMWGDPPRQLPPEKWKLGMMLGLADVEYAPSIDGHGVWPLIDTSSSALDVQTFSLLIELIYSFGAERGVRFRTDKATTMRRIEEANL